MHKKTILYGLVLSFAFFGFSFSSVSAATVNLHGWAWTENFGWISFNSSDAGAGGGPYSVNIDTTTGNWSGYAWSENLGWISFNSTDVVTNCGAAGLVAPNINLGNGAVIGGAYASSIGTSAGCINLSGVSMNITDGKFAGYAWGGDSTSQSGPGWIQFNPSATVYVSCPDCVSGAVSGNCIANPPYLNLPTGSTHNVTFTAAGSGGTAPYHYNWSGAGYDAVLPYNQKTLPYSAAGSGPTVQIKDSLNVESSVISCPSVTFQDSKLSIGKTVLNATLSSLTVKRKNQFVLKWNIALSDDYTCSPFVSPDPDFSNWNLYWKALSLNPSTPVDNTITWSGNTPDPSSNNFLVAGDDTLNPGMYSFGISCTSPTNPIQSVSVPLKVNLSGESEI